MFIFFYVYETNSCISLSLSLIYIMSFILFKKSFSYQIIYLPLFYLEKLLELLFFLSLFWPFFFFVFCERKVKRKKKKIYYGKNSGMNTEYRFVGPTFSKRSSFTADEERLIIQLHSQLGNKWSRMAAQVIKSRATLFPSLFSGLLHSS